MNLEYIQGLNLARLLLKAKCMELAMDYPADDKKADEAYIILSHAHNHIVSQIPVSNF